MPVIIGGKDEFFFPYINAMKPIPLNMMQAKMYPTEIVGFLDMPNAPSNEAVSACPGICPVTASTV